MNAIQVRYLSPTNTRGGRLVAVADVPDGRLVIGYPHEAGEGEKAHRVAAEALAARLGWDARSGYAPLRGGRLPDGSYAFTLAIDELHTRAVYAVADMRTIADEIGEPDKPDRIAAPLRRAADRLAAALR